MHNSIHSACLLVCNLVTAIRRPLDSGSHPTSLFHWSSARGAFRALSTGSPPLHTVETPNRFSPMAVDAHTAVCAE